VEVLQKPRVETISGGTSVSGMWSGTGGENSHHDRNSQHTREGAAHRSHGWGDAPPGSFRSSSNSIDQDSCHPHQDSGEEVVQANDVGVEVCQHGNSTDDGLSRNSEAEAEGHAEEFGTLLTHSHDKRKQGNCDDDQREGQQTIAEFDQAVETHFRRRNERVLRAAGPGGTSEPGASKTHGATGSYDQNLADQRSPGRDADTAIDHIG